MSELKAFDVGLGRYAEDGSPCIVAFDADQNPRLLDEQIYLKAEADKVIAEKDAEIERLRGESCKLTDGCLRLKQCRREKANIADKLRHSNHKRCLAMAQWCMDAECKTEKDADFLVRWEYRWLALAEEPTWEKFLQLIHKEAK